MLTRKLTADHEFTVPFTTEAGQTPGGYSEQVPTTLTQGAIGSLPLLANIAAGLDIVSISLSHLLSSLTHPTPLRISSFVSLSEDTSPLLFDTSRRTFERVSSSNLSITETLC